MRSRRSILYVVVLLALCVILALTIPGEDEPGSEGTPDARTPAAKGTTGGPADPAVARGDRPQGTEPEAGGDARAGDQGDQGDKGDEGDDDEPGDHDFERETPYSVSVRVLDVDGRPVDSRVKILDPRVEWSFGRLPNRGPGAFSGHLPEAGKYAAEADIAGTLVRTPFVVTDEDPEAIVVIGLTGSGSVSGTIYGGSGLLADGVRGEQKVLGQTDLTVDLVHDPVPESGPFPVLAGRVTAEGRYRIAGVPSGAYLLRVKNRFHAERIEIGENEHRTHDIHLGGGRIHGRVTERTSGDPLTEVQVVLQMSRGSVGRSGRLGIAGFGSISDRLTPDADGRYSFPNLPPGEYVMFANGVAYAPLRRIATITTDTPEIEVDFPLDLGSSVDITITDVDGNPLDSPLWMTQGIRCGFIGDVGGLRAGTSDFTAFAPGHEIQVRRDVVFEPGKPTELRFRLAPAAVTKLVFRDARGRPVPGVRVAVKKEGADLQVLMETFARERGLPLRETGPDGVIEVRGARAGPVRVVAKKTGFAHLDRTVVLKDGRETLDVPMTAADTTFTWRVRIAAVSPGAPADRLGLRIGDDIVAYDGKEIGSSRALSEAVRAAKDAGEEMVPMAVERDGARIEVEVAPGVLGVRLEEVEDSR